MLGGGLLALGATGLTTWNQRKIAEADRVITRLEAVEARQERVDAEEIAQLREFQVHVKALSELVDAWYFDNLTEFYIPRSYVVVSVMRTGDLQTLEHAPSLVRCCRNPEMMKSSNSFASSGTRAASRDDPWNCPGSLCRRTGTSDCFNRSA